MFQSLLDIAYRDINSAMGGRQNYHDLLPELQGALEQIRGSLATLPTGAQDELRPVLTAGAERAQPKEYDCLGCPVCWPANALNLAGDAFPEASFGEDGACPTDTPELERGWPGLPGEYRVLDSAGHVAVCVLTSQSLMENVATARPAGAANLSPSAPYDS